MTNTKISSLRNRKNKKAAAVVVCVIRPACSHPKELRGATLHFFWGGKKKNLETRLFFFAPEPYHLSQLAPSHR